MAIGPNRNHVGLIQYSEPQLINVEFDFEDTQEKGAILQKISDLRYQSGRATYTGMALKILLDSVRCEIK